MCTYVMNKVVGVRLVKCPFKFKLCSYSEKVIIFLSSLAFLFAWMKLWISSFRSRIHTSSLSLPYTPPTPTYFFSSHTNIYFLAASMKWRTQWCALRLNQCKHIILKYIAMGSTPCGPLPYLEFSGNAILCFLTCSAWPSCCHHDVQCL